jgi:hypothetical protein
MAEIVLNHVDGFGFDVPKSVPLKNLQNTLKKGVFLIQRRS